MATCLGVEHNTAWPLSPLDLWAGSFISDSVVHSHWNGGGDHSSIDKQLLRTGYFLVGNWKHCVCVCACMYTCVSRSEEGVKCLPLLLSTCSFEEMSLWVWSRCFSARLDSSKHPWSSCFYLTQCMEYPNCNLACYMGAGIWTPVLRLAQQVPVIAEPSLQTPLVINEQR